MAGWAVRPPAVAAPAASTGVKPKPKPAWGAAGLASDGFTAEERELQEALEASRQAEKAAAAAAEAEEERQLAAVLEASRVAEEARQRQEKEARVAMEVRRVCIQVLACVRLVCLVGGGTADGCFWVVVVVSRWVVGVPCFTFRHRCACVCAS